MSKKDKKSVVKKLHDSDSDEAETGKSKRVKVEGPIVLPDDVEFMQRGESDEIKIWDDATDTSKTLKVVCYEETLYPPSALPITAKRPHGKDKVEALRNLLTYPKFPNK